MRTVFSLLAATSALALCLRRAEAALPCRGGGEDSNLPMSLKILAVTIGGSGTGGRSHAVDEWIDVEKGPSVKGMSVGLAAPLATAGVE